MGRMKGLLNFHQDANKAKTQGLAHAQEFFSTMAQKSRESRFTLRV